MDRLFKKGDIVKLTDKAKELFPTAKRTGTVSKNSRGVTVFVIGDGNKSGQNWSVKFWELLEASCKER